MRSLPAILVLLLAAPAAAQVASQPASAPIVTAENDVWYRQRQPLPFAGDVYYPAGATVFFNGNTMVRTGHYHGVPLYVDATIEPYSIILVPIAGGLMQPYERVRHGDLAGTSGSRTPSFPVRTDREPAAVPMAAGAPMAGQPADMTRSGEPGAVGTSGRVSSPPVALATSGVEPRVPPLGGNLTAQRARGNVGVWIEYMGERWVSVGPAVPLRGREFVEVGDYKGFPVYARTGLQEDRIYLPSTGGVVPFRLKE